MNEALKNKVEKGMDLYFEMKENQHILNEPNKMLLAQVENVMAELNNNAIKSYIDNRLESYDQTHDVGYNNTANIPIIKESHPLVRTRTNPEVVKTQSAGFINAAILLYGIINIGIILAIAFMK